jgi:arsenate reductase
MKRKVLFLSIDNSCRSQMAEGIVNTRFGRMWDAFSAGTKPVGSVHPKVVSALVEIGIYHSGRSKHVDEFKEVDFDLVFTFSDKAADECPSWLDPAKRIHHSFPDPAITNKSDDFRKVRDEMVSLFSSLLKQIG